LDSDNKEEIERNRTCTITSKEATFALKKLHKYIESNECMKDLFKPPGYLENRTENNVLNKHKQLSLEQFFKNNL